jgi:hypothetical protein
LMDSTMSPACRRCRCAGLPSSTAETLRILPPLANFIMLYGTGTVKFALTGKGFYGILLCNAEVMESWLSGLRRTTGNRVRVNSPPRVQIPDSPPKPLSFKGFIHFFTDVSFAQSGHLLYTTLRK